MSVLLELFQQAGLAAGILGTMFLVVWAVGWVVGKVLLFFFDR